MDRVHRADGNQVKRVAVLDEYLTWRAPTKARRGSMPGPGARTMPTAISRWAGSTTRSAVGHAEGAEMLCEPAEKLMRSGHEPQARLLWQQARADYPTTSGSMCRRASGTATTPELAMRTGDPESALEQLRPLRASCLSALGRPSDEIQKRAAQGEQGEHR